MCEGTSALCAPPTLAQTAEFGTLGSEPTFAATHAIDGVVQEADMAEERARASADLHAPPREYQLRDLRQIVGATRCT